MSKPFSALHHDPIQEALSLSLSLHETLPSSSSRSHPRTVLFSRLSEPIRESLTKARYNPPEGSNVSIKSMLMSLLPQTNSQPKPNLSETEIHSQVRDFSLCCAALASSAESTHDQLSWIPDSLSIAANSAFRDLSKAVTHGLSKIGELGFDLGLVLDGTKLVAESMIEVLPSLKSSIKDSAIDRSDDGNEISASLVRSPVAYAVVAAYQFRWFVTQGQGMVSFIHLAKNVNAAELGWYEDVVLDACFQNIASSDEIWHLVVEMSVVLLDCIWRSNPHSTWFERMLSEMLSHLERHPRNKECRISWLKHIEQLFNVVGLVLLAHFRLLFPLFFQWMHAADDETILLVRTNCSAMPEVDESFYS
ncbi:ARM repeat superfamily protein [Actinidia rufa]|uniref:ARM repeat superfamily protein n=1 Tax=Actinidia rufa TaxID=165716 RepID=A0A7J0EBA1_9ERIC|nr:ARM repeat superfamily protein [Actinidia rufa]